MKFRTPARLQINVKIDMAPTRSTSHRSPKDSSPDVVWQNNQTAVGRRRCSPRTPKASIDELVTSLAGNAGSSGGSQKESPTLLAVWNNSPPSNGINPIPTLTPYTTRSVKRRINEQSALQRLKKQHQEELARMHEEHLDVASASSANDVSGSASSTAGPINYTPLYKENMDPSAKQSQRCHSNTQVRRQLPLPQHHSKGPISRTSTSSQVVNHQTPFVAAASKVQTVLNDISTTKRYVPYSTPYEGKENANPSQTSTSGSQVIDVQLRKELNKKKAQAKLLRKQKELQRQQQQQQQFSQSISASQIEAQPSSQSFSQRNGLPPVKPLHQRNISFMR